MYPGRMYSNLPKKYILGNIYLVPGNCDRGRTYAKIVPVYKILHFQPNDDNVYFNFNISKYFSN